MNEIEDEELDGARMLERLRLKNLSGKRNLIEDLKKRKSQRSVSLLVEMLQDESWYLREQAVKALCEAGEEAKEPLLKLLDEGLWYTRAAAAKVLGKIGGRDATEKLVNCLMDSNMTVQGAAATALIDIAKSTSVEDLAAVMSPRPADVKGRAVSCIRLLDRDVAQGVEECWEREIAGRRRGPAPRSAPDREN
jgi:HEAT repeat protein